MEIKQTSIYSNHKTVKSKQTDFKIKDLANSLGLEFNHLDDTQHILNSFIFKGDSNKILVYIGDIFIGLYVKKYDYYNSEKNDHKLYFASKNTFNIALKYVKDAIHKSVKHPKDI